jgi:hypothetical protein
MRAAAAALALALAAGCAGTSRYDDGGAAKNLTVRTASSARAALHVHAVDAQCATQYLGTVALDRPSVEVGIPAGRLSWLEFSFETSGFLASRRTQTSRGTLLHPRAGARYEAEVSYRDDIYGVVLRDGRRELPLLDFSSCRPAR